MKKFKKFSSVLFTILMTVILFSSCNKDDKNNMDGTSKLIIHLTDGPGDFSEVHVNVKDVMINRDNAGWVSMTSINGGDYDLLKLTGGTKAMIAEGDVPSGIIHQIRLVLEDEGNYLVTKDGEKIIMDTPSGQQSGLKLQLDQELVPNYVYNFIFDFDVDQSVVKAGNSGQYNLKPVLRISAEVSSGIITGAVTNEGIQVMASVTTPEGEVISAYTDENGIYAIYGIEAGIYDVMLTAPVGSELNDAIIEDVEVINGQITEVPEITLTEATSGSISGKITNEGVSAVISVMIDQDTTLSVDSAEDGTFSIPEIPGGTYNVVISPSTESGLSDTTLEDITVVNGDDTSLGEISLE